MECPCHPYIESTDSLIMRMYTLCACLHVYTLCSVHVYTTKHTHSVYSGLFIIASTNKYSLGMKNSASDSHDCKQTTCVMQELLGGACTKVYV